ncbi:MAG: hypothetical protein H7Y41_03630 [Hyphomonadaceae bacterium]|nr:hypothetical protein [Clostridia bacterium]
MITVSLISSKDGEIKRFFEGMNRREEIECAVAEWICTFRELHSAMPVIAKLLEGDFDIKLWIQEDEGDVKEIKQQYLARWLQQSISA